VISEEHEYDMAVERFLPRLWALLEGVMDLVGAGPSLDEA
jgi:hypothetical protein